MTGCFQSVRIDYLIDSNDIHALPLCFSCSKSHSSGAPVKLNLEKERARERRQNLQSTVSRQKRPGMPRVRQTKEREEELK